jgi:hypothetical protein
LIGVTVLPQPQLTHLTPILIGALGHFEETLEKMLTWSAFDFLVTANGIKDESANIP